MHISKIQLENIKSHVSSTFEFNRGTTAITGENGAGKTSIIEAVAWVLFDLLEYKKEDFVRRGAKKGSVTVTLESGLDEREYIVYRDTGTGYYVTDPRLQTRIAEKKEEVFRFLWQHLGLEPGTDLRTLFKQAIGVPQGTFTAIFLEGATERKTAFDRLLKVEEYRQAAERLRETSRFLDASVAGVRESIARAEGELSRAENIEEEHKTYTEQTSALAEELEVVSKTLAAKQELVTALDQKERKISELQTGFERLNAEKEKTELVIKQLDEDVRRASDAASKISEVRTLSQRHVETLGHLKELERERGERDHLRRQLADVDTALANVRADQKRLNQDVERVQKAHLEVESLRPKAAEQDKLENETAALREKLFTGKAAQNQIRSIDEKLARLRENYKINKEKLTEAEAMAAAAAALSTLEQREAVLTRDLAALQAGLERDERFQSEIRNGLCPILSQKCLNLKDGETLESFVSSQFTEIRTQISTIESEHVAVRTDLQAARQAAQFAAALEEYKQRGEELTEEGQRYSEEKAELSRQVNDLAELERLFAATESALKELADPRSRIRFLETELAREVDLRLALSEVEANLERLTSDRRILDEQLETYRDLDKKWDELSKERDATLEAHRVFLANEAEANSLPEREKKLVTARSEFDALHSQYSGAEKELNEAKGAYDADQHRIERASLLEAEKLAVQKRSMYDVAKDRAEKLAAELQRFAEVRRTMQAEFKQKERLEKVSETTAFIRDTLKEAAPRVARNYVYHVSIEAGQLYREITGNAECTLKWAEEYSILLEEDGYERPFASLSGGEQMAAALSVRLALLKQLTDIRIAFFDEPTANMDAERRENLAMQISRITNFDQLFVISHDETFDNFVDNVVSL